MGNFIGEVRIFAFNYAPINWLPCNGATLEVKSYTILYSVIGNTFGGNGTTTFMLPNISGKAVMGSGAGQGLTSRSLGEVVGKNDHMLTIPEMPSHRHRITASAPTATLSDSISPAGNFPAKIDQKPIYSGNSKLIKLMELDQVQSGKSIPHNNMQPSLVMNYCICNEGEYPASGGISGIVGEPYLGEIKMFAGIRIPDGWAVCDGRLLRIDQNDALYELLGTKFGGDGIYNFALPDLRGRVPVSQGNSGTNKIYVIGSKGGVENQTLLLNNLPRHTHFNPSILADKIKQFANASSTGKADGTFGLHAAIVPGEKRYGKTKSSNLTGSLLKLETEDIGGNQTHNNMQSTICLHYIIALNGIYPTSSNNF